MVLLAHSAQGAIRTQALPAIPVHGSTAVTYGVIYAPDAAVHAPPYPGISILPGGGADTNSVSWAAQLLARDGYVTVIVKPTSGSSTQAYNLAAQTGIDVLVSSANPFRAETDTARIGACGWSLGARSLTRTQEEDPRIDAVVEWDNLAISESGDAGSPSCTNTPNPIRTPRVPAMGQASEMCSAPADAKLTAFNYWRTAGVPSAEIVFKHSNHFLWSGTSGTNAQHDASHYYTLAWFDRWLKGDLTAVDRIVAGTILGIARDSLLSATYWSGVYCDAYDCDDLVAACPSQPAAVEAMTTRAIISVAPNPARGHIRVLFTLPRDSEADVGVFDLHGARVATLITGVRAAGTHEAAWDGTCKAGTAPAGVYFVRFSSAGATEVRRVVLLEPR
jgi:hypothetical protein